jgi:hypothetical protein
MHASIIALRSSMADCAALLAQLAPNEAEQIGDALDDTTVELEALEMDRDDVGGIH